MSAPVVLNAMPLNVHPPAYPAAVGLPAYPARAVLPDPLKMPTAPPPVAGVLFTPVAPVARVPAPVVVVPATRKYGHHTPCICFCTGTECSGCAHLCTSCAGCATNACSNAASCVGNTCSTCGSVASTACTAGADCLAVSFEIAAKVVKGIAACIGGLLAGM